MADSVELRMSITSLKRVDPYAKDILTTATHVALYKFNTSTNEWEKTETEGALFVYRRNGEPFHSIMVMNRLNTNNLIEPIVKDFDYQMQQPFLLYRNAKSKIFGIWFFDRDECIRTTFLIESLMEGLKDKTTEKSRKKQNGVDIFSMLSKAQEDFNKTPTKQDGSLTFSSTSTPRVPDGTSQSVMDFFAKASTKSSQKPVSGDSENVLQRLMSNPAHSVEHIEKQQRSITPQDQAKRKTHVGQGDRRSVPISFPSNRNSERKNFTEDNSNPGNIRLSPPQTSTQGTSPLALLLQGQCSTTQKMPTEEQTETFGSPAYGSYTDSSVQLMTPMMFTTPKEKAGSVSSSTTIPLKDGAETIDLLTEKQLAQALIHLLKTNSEFTKKIHEAYVNSIMEKVNSSSSTSSLFN